MDFRLLGPVEVYAGGQPVDLGPKQQRFVAAVLALEVNRMVQVDRLVDLIWPVSPPRTAIHAVRVCVSRLRAVLADAAAGDEPTVELTGHGDGYTLRADPLCVDAHRFRALVSRAKTILDEDALVRTLRDALALWRGRALTNVTSEPVRDRLCGGLEEARRVAVEDLFDARLRRGEHREVLDELTGAVRADPTRERLAGQLMLALYRGGQRAEALALYRATRQRLTDELGLDPGRELRDLETAILRGDPALDPAPRDRHSGPTPQDQPGVQTPAQLPRAVAAFAGRVEELRRLDELLAAGLNVPVVAIGGAAGVGKTTLAVHWAHRVAARFPDGQLYVNLRGFDPDGTATTPGEALRRFLDALLDRPGRIPAELDAQAAMYRSLLAGRRVLIVLDNAASVEQVRPLLPGSPGCAVVVTSRARLTSLIVAEGAHPLTLDVMPPADAHELLVRRIGGPRVDADLGATAAIIDRCAGLPLALAIVAARAATNPRLDLASLSAELHDVRDRLDAFAGDDPATDVRAVFSWSYQALGAATARMFRLLGLHVGDDIALPAAASLAGCAPVEADRHLAELVRAHLVVEHAGHRYALHDLLRAYAGELTLAHDDATDRAAALRRVLDHYLHTAYAADRLLDPHARDMVIRPPAAGVVPYPLTDYHAAMTWFTADHANVSRAITAAAHRFDTHAWQLARTLVTFYSLKADWHALIATNRAALQAARRADDSSGQAYAHRILGRTLGRLGALADARRHHGAALRLFDRIGDHAGAGRARMDLVWTLITNGHHREALAHAHRALGVCRTVNDRVGLAIALNGVGWCHAQLGEYESSLHNCEQALSGFLAAGCEAGAWHAWDSIGYAHHHLGRYDRAVECFAQALDGFRRTGDRYGQVETLTHLGDNHRAAGHHDLAQVAWREALAILDELGHPDAADVRERLRTRATPV